MIYHELEELWRAETHARQEFYEEIEDGVKMEFINGETIMHSPDRIEHVITRKCLVNLLNNYVLTHALGLVADEKLLVCLTRNDYMPDVVFYGREKAAKIVPGQMQFPAPDFVAEVLSPSTRRRDRGVKFEDYAAHGVAEYWLLDPATQTVEIFHLTPLGEYALATKVRGESEARSSAIRGFRVQARALFDEAANLAALKKLLR